MSITIQQEECPVTIQPGIQVITVNQVLGCPITIQGGNIVTSTTIVPFSIVATANGQANFALAVNPQQIICLFLMGGAQDVLAGDYTWNGNIITLSPALAALVQAGWRVFGAAQL